MKVIQSAKSLKYIFGEYWIKDNERKPKWLRNKEWDPAEISLGQERMATILQDVCISFRLIRLYYCERGEYIGNKNSF